MALAQECYADGRLVRYPRSGDWLDQSEAEMVYIRLAHIVNWMYGRDAGGNQPKWTQTSGEIAFWLDEPDDEIFLINDYLDDNFSR